METRQTKAKLVVVVRITLQNYKHIHTSRNTLGHSQCIAAQALIGWTVFLEGLMSIQWVAIQDRFYKEIGIRRSGTRWAIDLSKELWILVFSMWDHHNKVLFLSDKVDKLSELDKIKVAVTQEWHLGLGNLDIAFKLYFQLSSLAF